MHPPPVRGAPLETARCIAKTSAPTTSSTASTTGRARFPPSLPRYSTCWPASSVSSLRRW
ncbi:hypothetical protein AOA73_11255 [Pseudomonas aeruginosa]|nr:hypothetical protein AOA74_16235 [Pseudomonas aeruginosa]KPE37088.1 hypothetical protein AOA73_11255 [Pseudomonas aeruginosa]KPE42126.1 hypothetical protein AOA75_02480 [Pseudomonas aeruginosa]